MTPTEAADRIRTALDGSAIVAASLGQRPGEWLPVRRRDLQLVVDAVRPMSVAESEAKRAERAAMGDSGITDAAAPLPTAATAPQPLCKLRYDADVCALSRSHPGECCDSDGNPLEIPF
jgi:hypothetical protein